MKMNMFRPLLALLAALPLTTGAHAGTPIDTLAGRLGELDRFTETENMAGLDAYRLDGQNWGDFDILFAAVVADGNFVGAVTSPESAFTLFAPTDGAFRELAFDLTGQVLLTEQAVLDAIVGLVGAGAVDLERVLSYHIVGGKFELANVPVRQRIPTVNGEAILIQPRLGGSAFEVKDTVGAFRNPFIRAVDQDAGNSTIHIIDRVLIPSNVAGS